MRLCGRGLVQYMSTRGVMTCRVLSLWAVTWLCDGGVRRKACGIGMVTNAQIMAALETSMCKVSDGVWYVTGREATQHVAC